MPAHVTAIFKYKTLAVDEFNDHQIIVDEVTLQLQRYQLGFQCVWKPWLCALLGFTRSLINASTKVQTVKNVSLSQDRLQLTAWFSRLRSLLLTTINFAVWKRSRSARLQSNTRAELWSDRATNRIVLWGRKPL